ncbi:MAG: DUF2500 domain-containing protein [Lachnospiraceae bacterium]|nr:DUF2500 domain-containing protein [Lachnospiraceae bacterium]
MTSFGLGFNFYSLFDILFPIVFILVIGVFVVTAVRGLRTWNRNNHSPRLTVVATIVSKRMNVHHYHHGGTADGVHHSSTSTSYYVTFQVESGDRMELSVEGREYGLLAEGDSGKLTFQGTRYLSFDRV